MTSHNSERVGVSRAAAAAALLAALLAACAGTDHPDNASALAAISAAKSGLEVEVEGRVEAVEPSQTGSSGTHEHFRMRITSNTGAAVVDVADNITVGQIAPVKRGDDVIVKGVLEVDPSGPVIHWTHHDPRLRHEPGFVEVGGTRYD